MGPPPAHLLGQQDPPHLAAPHLDAGVPGRLAQAGKTVTDLAVALALGGDCLADIAMLPR
jgi:hypothetical protein